MISMLDIQFYPRKSKKYGKIYYYRIKNLDGTRTTGISTYQHTKTAAKTYVKNLIAHGLISKNSNETFADFAKNWWIWDKCSYVQYKRLKAKSKRKDKKRSKRTGITQSYVKICRGYLTNHILPYFKDYRLYEITPKKIENWLKSLYNNEQKNISATTINHCLKTLKTMFNEAVRLEILSRNPASKVSPYIEDPKEKSILSEQQVKEMNTENNIGRIWNMDLVHYTIHLLASLCGMRMGEIQALQVNNINFDEGEIYIAQSWERGFGLKEPKCGSKRFIVVPKKVLKYLKLCIKSNQFNSPDDLVFYSRDRYKPIGDKMISKYFYKALYAIGISEEQRREENITFHSCRHFFNSYLRNHNIKDHKIRFLTGHESEEMTDNYTKFKSENFSDVRSLQEKLVG